ncbi:hypothetical protein WSS15_28520 [Acetobacter pasteurianus]|nr:hypothetical protein WSS15_28520 [Acetobacter pasteurianus]
MKILCLDPPLVRLNTPAQRSISLTSKQIIQSYRLFRYQKDNIIDWCDTVTYTYDTALLMDCHESAGAFTTGILGRLRFSQPLLRRVMS